MQNLIGYLNKSYQQQPLQRTNQRHCAAEIINCLQVTELGWEEAKRVSERNVKNKRKIVGDWCSRLGLELLPNPLLWNGPEMSRGTKSIELQGVTYTWRVRDADVTGSCICIYYSNRPFKARISQGITTKKYICSNIFICKHCITWKLSSLICDSED